MKAVLPLVKHAVTHAKPVQQKSNEKNFQEKV